MAREVLALASILKLGMYIHSNIHLNQLVLYRGSCTIEDPITDSIIVTGGMGNEVTRYDLLGYLEDLPSMLRTRNAHGCGSYINSDGDQVRRYT